MVESLHQRLVRQFSVQVADWVDTCRGLANWEDQNLIEEKAENRLTEHAAMLDELERVGRWLSASGPELGHEAGALLEQIRLTSQDLQDSRAMWHGRISEGRKLEILRDCLNES